MTCSRIDRVTLAFLDRARRHARDGPIPALVFPASGRDELDPGATHASGLRRRLLEPYARVNCVTIPRVRCVTAMLFHRVLDLSVEAVGGDDTVVHEPRNLVDLLEVDERPRPRVVALVDRQQLVRRSERAHRRGQIDGP